MLLWFSRLLLSYTYCVLQDLMCFTFTGFGTLSLSLYTRNFGFSLKREAALERQGCSEYIHRSHISFCRHSLDFKHLSRAGI